MDRPHFIYPFFSWWTLGCFFLLLWIVIYEHSCTSTVLNVCVTPRGPSPQPDHAGTLNADFQPPELWAFLLFINHLLYGMLYSSFNGLRHLFWVPVYIDCFYSMCHVLFLPINIHLKAHIVPHLTSVSPCALSYLNKFLTIEVIYVTAL